MDFKKTCNDIRKSIDKNSPEILIGFGLAGMLTSTILAVKATPKAHKLLGEAEERKGEELTKLEIFKIVWKPYLPTALGYCASAACILGAHSIDTKRNATLLTACKLGETALREYREKVVEVIGEETEKKIRDDIAKDRIDRDVKHGSSDVVVTGNGSFTCYDMISGRYFKSDMNTIQKVQNDLNYMMMNENYVSLNDLYLALDMTCTDIGNDVGWNVEDGLIEITFSSIISEAGEPCLVMNFDKSPKMDFDRIG